MLAETATNRRQLDYLSTSPPHARYGPIGFIGSTQAVGVQGVCRAWGGGREEEGRGVFRTHGILATACNSVFSCLFGVA